MSSRTVVLRGAALGLALAGVVACSDSPAVSGRVAGAPAATRSAATSADAASPPVPPPGSLTLSFAGDVHFARQLASVLDHPATGLAELRPQLAGADLTMVNLETAITGRGVEQPKTYHFRAPPTALSALQAAGVDVVTLANNHAVDYGPDGLVDTLAARRASPVPVVGIGADESDAYAPALLTVRGERVAVLAATQVPDWTASHFGASGARPGVALALDPARLARAVREVRSRADVVVVYLHWGTDYTGCPNPLQVRTATALAAAGADVVVGAHAHQVQGGGWLGSAYVDYGLGNFVWYGRNTPEQAATGVLTLTLQGRHVTAERWVPLEVSADGIPRPPAAARAAQLTAQRDHARLCAGLAAHG